MDLVRQKLRLLARALVICLLLVETALRYGLAYLGYRLTGRSLADRQALFGESVLGLFRRLGATFIKVGQIMSTRPDLLPPHVIAALSRLQDDVGPFPFAQVERTVIEDFGQPIAALFREFSPQPIASASVAQVHRARLPDGHLVAVKVPVQTFFISDGKVLNQCWEMVKFALKSPRVSARFVGLCPIGWDAVIMYAAEGFTEGNG